MTTLQDWSPAEGGCSCGTIRYRLENSPLVVHCCHCTFCQRESTSAFALNAMIETKFVKLLSTEKPVAISIPTASGAKQHMHHCPKCQMVVWSNYGDAGDVVRYVRVGTLDDPSTTPPNIHIFTSTKQPWVILGDDLPVKEEYYQREEIWSKASMERREKLIDDLGLT